MTLNVRVTDFVGRMRKKFLVNRLKKDSLERGMSVEVVLKKDWAWDEACEFVESNLSREGDLFDDLAKQLAEKFRRTREKALEDAAKRCEREATGLHAHLPPGLATQRMAAACTSCASGIRRLT